MDDTTIITDADYGFGIDGTRVITGSVGIASTGVITGACITRPYLGIARTLTVSAVTGRVYVDADGVWHYEPEAPEPTKPEAAPRKPSPSLPVEAWATREFDAEQAHAATLALCRGQ